LEEVILENPTAFSQKEKEKTDNEHKCVCYKNSSEDGKQNNF